MSEFLRRYRHKWRPSPRKVITASGAAVVAVCIWWLVSAWSRVTITDARVVADVVTLRSEVNAQVTGVMAREGQWSDSDALLIKLDDRAARANVAEQAAKLERLVKSWRQLESVGQNAQHAALLTSVDANLDARSAKIVADAARVRLEQSQMALERSTRLAADGLVARVSLDQDHRAHELARLDAAAAASLQARKAVELRRARLAGVDANANVLAAGAAEAAVKEGAAVLDMAKLAMSRCEVRARRPGIVAKLFVRLGDSVVDGQRLLLQYDPRTIRIEARVNERDLIHFPIGKRVRVSIDATGDRERVGVVTSVGALTQAASADWPQQPEQGNFVRVAQRIPVQIALLGGGEGLIPGTLAKVWAPRR